MKLVILDRDGVINFDSDSYIKSPEEWNPIPGSIAAILKLNRAGFIVAVATNQSGIARGLFDNHTLQEIHRKMINAVSEVGGRIEAIFYCPHSNTENCNCRKPKSGMFESILSRFNISSKNSYAVGDSLRDLQAAEKVGINAPILVLTGKGEKFAKHPDLPKSTLIFKNLSEAVDYIVGGAL